MVQIYDGWLVTARHCPSPNFNARPNGVAIDLLVIHNISLPAGEFGTGCIEDLFLNCLDCTQHPSFAGLESLQVSAHCLIERNGQVVQFVPFDQRAWHAGVSQYQGRSDCNHFSIGIELEGTDHIPYGDAQYEALAELTRALIAAYPGITPERIVGHSDIAPQRKTDPGPAFDWTRYRRMIGGCALLNE